MAEVHQDDRSACRFDDLDEVRKRATGNLPDSASQSRHLRGGLMLVDIEVWEGKRHWHVECAEQVPDKEYERISHSQQIRELGGRIGQEFYEAEGSVMDVIRAALSELDKLKGLDETIAQLHQALADAAQIISDCEGEVSNLAFMAVDDEARLEEITQRLDQINSLLYKHRVRDTAELEQLFEEKRASILDFDSLDERIEELSAQIEADFLQLKEVQIALSKKRGDAAAMLASELQAAIRSLAIANARFEISIDKKASEELLSSECLAAISLSGAESCEFLFSANPGTELAPLAEVASGGELSRVLPTKPKPIVASTSGRTRRTPRSKARRANWPKVPMQPLRRVSMPRRK